MSVRSRILPHGDTVATAGTRLICPCCRSEIGRFAMNYSGADSIGLDLFKWADGQNRDTSTAAICKGCGASAIRDSKTLTRHGVKRYRVFHLADGWVGHEIMKS